MGSSGLLLSCYDLWSHSLKHLTLLNLYKRTLMIICYFSISILPLWVLGTGHIWIAGFYSTGCISHLCLTLAYSSHSDTSRRWAVKLFGAWGTSPMTLVQEPNMSVFLLSRGIKGTSPAKWQQSVDRSVWFSTEEKIILKVLKNGRINVNGYWRDMIWRETFLLCREILKAL